MAHSLQLDGLEFLIALQNIPLHFPESKGKDRKATKLEFSVFTQRAMVDQVFGASSTK